MKKSSNILFPYNSVIKNNLQLSQVMQDEDHFERKKSYKKLRIRIKTNRNLDFITAVRSDATISDLANRALSAYLELSEQGGIQTIKKQLTVSAVKQGIFYMPKSELAANLLNQDDEVEVVIIKAKPKYPNQFYQNNEVINRNAPMVKNASPPKEIIAEKQIISSKSEQNQQIDIEEKIPIIAQKSQKKQNLSVVSKRQKKKQKKKEKFQKRRKDEQTKTIFKGQTKFVQHQLKDNLQQIQPIDGGPRKKLKIDNEPIYSPEKLPTIAIPSPKITFHNQPKIQSPRFSLLGDSIKKKFAIEAQPRKQSDDFQKKNQVQKFLSPLLANKSPMINQRTPNMSASGADKIKEKDRDQLSNFMLSTRKMSEDKKIEVKKQKLKEDTLKKQTDQKIIMEREEQSSNKKEQPLLLSQKKQQPNTLTKSIVNTLVVQQDDSDSEQNKKTNQLSHSHHRQKQLSEIQKKISTYQIQSEDQN